MVCLDKGMRALTKKASTVHYESSNMEERICPRHRYIIGACAVLTAELA
jgi:hypothetical protein